MEEAMKAALKDVSLRYAEDGANWQWILHLSL